MCQLGCVGLVKASVFPWRVLMGKVRSPHDRKSFDGDETELIIRIAAVGSRLSQAIAIGDVAGGQQGVLAVREVVSEMRRRKSPVTVSPSVPVRSSNRTHFVVDSLFLADAKRFLVGKLADQIAGVRERFHYVTGIKMDRAHLCANAHCPSGFLRPVGIASSRR